MKVRLTIGTSGDKDFIRASTQIGNKTLTASGLDERSAIANLKDIVDRHTARKLLRAEYPKIVEVKL